ncbi:hypothetical protein [Thorsellia anophelis]|uniref:Uncharacterized protein n=1 Tax=Thorsellia anophelis DSM 18579 TaxID=1123402 RepID=A0A1I0DUB7_9GAMM|nr:hypothetical protein [Thorsellia anophelis]SET36233.1 hypothetical protein SAMN02583745_02127 [Thorsellia anophelis DSM 18579]
MLNKARPKIAILSITILLSGCGEITPKCDDDGVKQSVAELVQKKSDEGIWYKSKHSGPLEVINISTQSHDEKIDIYTCAADIKYSMLGAFFKFPVTYTVQKTEDKNGTYHINLLSF